MTEPGEKIVRLSVELPAGVTVKTRSTMPRLESFSTLIDAFLPRTSSSEHRSNTPTLLELEFPEAMSTSVLDALKRIVTVGRVK